MNCYLGLEAGYFISSRSVFIRRLNSVSAQMILMLIKSTIDVTRLVSALVVLVQIVYLIFHISSAL